MHGMARTACKGDINFQIGPFRLGSKCEVQCYQSCTGEITLHRTVWLAKILTRNSSQVDRGTLLWCKVCMHVIPEFKPEHRNIYFPTFSIKYPFPKPKALAKEGRGMSTASFKGLDNFSRVFFLGWSSGYLLLRVSVFTVDLLKVTSFFFPLTYQ